MGDESVISIFGIGIELKVDLHKFPNFEFYLISYVYNAGRILDMLHDFRLCLLMHT